MNKLFGLMVLWVFLNASFLVSADKDGTTTAKDCWYSFLNYYTARSALKEFAENVPLLNQRLLEEGCEKLEGDIILAQYRLGRLQKGKENAERVLSRKLEQVGCPENVLDQLNILAGKAEDLGQLLPMAEGIVAAIENSRQRK